MSKGLWFFGLSGSGKTHISKKIFSKKRKAFLIDGDLVRKLISTDLGYTKSARVKQNKRVLGLAKIVIRNGFYPIISSVYLDPKIFVEAKKNRIRVIKVIGPKNRVNKKFSYKKNVVGLSIKQPKIKCEIYKSFDKS